MKQLANIPFRAGSLLSAGRILLIGVLIGLAGLYTAKLAWLIIEPQGSVARSHPIPRTASSAVNSTLPTFTTDVTVLVQQTRFGTGNAAIDVIPSAPETSLNLRLKGLRATSETEGTSEGAAMAIILTPDNTSKIYNIGDTIIDGVTLEQVFPDRALINRRGERETLMMDSSVGSLSVLSLPNEEGMIEGEPQLSPTPSDTSSNAKVINRALASSLKFNTVVEGGNLMGYSLDTSANPDAFNQIGLQTDDLLTGMNGDKIGDIEIQDILNSLSRSGDISLTVERGGTPQTISFRLSEGN
ncbi:MAG: type II secretion system protein N [Hyphomonas sp.]